MCIRDRSGTDYAENAAETYDREDALPGIYLESGGLLSPPGAAGPKRTQGIPEKNGTFPADRTEGRVTAE